MSRLLLVEHAQAQAQMVEQAQITQAGQWLWEGGGG